MQVNRRRGLSYLSAATIPFEIFKIQTEISEQQTPHGISHSPLTQTRFPPEILATNGQGFRVEIVPECFEEEICHFKHHTVT